jgi:RNA polymerase sigma factor (sigma-70 family)
MISLQIATQQKSSHNAYDDILEDDKGHINPELAQLIFKWEKQQRLNMNLPDFQNFSTRDGLRWVKDLVDQTLNRGGSSTTTTASARTGGGSSQHNTAAQTNYDDLIQEGVFSLMQALKNFEHESRPNESLESFAKYTIQKSLNAYCTQQDRSRVMGGGIGTSASAGSSSSKSGSSKRGRPPLSVESTVKIADPLETEDHYFNQDEWEIREGLVLDNGKSLQRDELVEDYLDEMLQYEGEDQMWIHEQSVAAPLRDSIPADSDDNMENILENPDSPDDMALADMILYNVDDFLGRTLDKVESQVIQMRFGLDDGEPKTQKDIAYGLGLTLSQVRKLQKRALEKLRKTFTERYASDSTSREDFWEDTV